MFQIWQRTEQENGKRHQHDHQRQKPESSRALERFFFFFFSLCLFLSQNGILTIHKGMLCFVLFCFFFGSPKLGFKEQQSFHYFCSCFTNKYLDCDDFFNIFKIIFALA
jgi:hypothetical protein